MGVRPWVVVLVACCCWLCGADPGRRVLVYGATGGGVAAALAAARHGVHVTLLAEGTHVGGMVTGGLQHTDVGNASVIGGIALEFFTRVERQYPGRPVDPSYPPGHRPTGWLFESHVAESVMVTMLKEAAVTVVRSVRGVASVTKVGTRLTTAVMLDGSRHTADVFIDGSYEGDLMAAANVSYIVGREGKAQYKEPGAGRQPYYPYGGQFPSGISPYDTGNTTLLPLVSPSAPVGLGEPDAGVMTYDFRLCMTNSPSNGVPIQQPTSYNPEEWELLRRVYARHPPKDLGGAGLHCLGPIPNNYTDCHPSCKKCDMIGGGSVNTDMVGASWDYPDASHEKRIAIRDAHITYTMGLLWFWGHDESVPAHVRSEMLSYGLCKDEYLDTQPPHWPHQLYVRAARRMVGDWVFTQVEPDAVHLNASIGKGSYVFDCHHVQRVVVPGKAEVMNEGEIMSGIAQAPYIIPFHTLLPKRKDATNFLAAVPVSASHVRFASLRMEPTWMIMGEAAGVTAAHCAKDDSIVQDVDIGHIQQVLRAEGAIL